MGASMAYSSHLCQEPSFIKGTKGLYPPCTLPYMRSDQSNEVLIVNILALMKAKGWSARELAKYSKVSDRMIGKILKSVSNPTTETLDKLACAFGIDAWQLLVPGITELLTKESHLGDVIHTYVDTDDDGRRVMESTAAYVTKRKEVPVNDPNGQPHKKRSGS